MRAIILCLVVLFAASARAQAPSGPLDPSNYKLDRTKGDIPLTVGRRFLDDLKARDAALAESVIEVARLEIQKEETRKFAHQSSLVMWAYGAAWALVAIFAALVFMRQRRLHEKLASLEARLAQEKP